MGNVSSKKLPLGIKLSYGIGDISNNLFIVTTHRWFRIGVIRLRQGGSSAGEPGYWCAHHLLPLPRAHDTAQFPAFQQVPTHRGRIRTG